MRAHPATKAALCFAVLLLFFAKLSYDLYSGATHPLNLNIANDLINHIWPFLTYVSDSAQSGSLPLWNPYIAIGNPMAGELGVGLFHPITWTIFIFEEVSTALLVNQFLTVLIGMTGAYLYGRYLDFQWPAQFLSVLLFGLAIFTESFSHTAGASSCWFPVVLYSTHRSFDQPTFRNAFYVAISLALCFLGGFANYFFYTCLIVGVYFGSLLMISFRENTFENSARRIGLMITAALFMAGLVCIQFLPAYELSELSVRSLNSDFVPYKNSIWEYFSPSLLFLNFLLPDHAYLFANNHLKINTGLFYLGGAVVLVPLFFLEKKFRTTAIALSASCVILFLFIASNHISILSFVGDIPFVGSLRIHGRGLVYIEFLLILIASMGISGLAEKHGAMQSSIARKHKLWTLLATCFTVIITAIALFSAQNPLQTSGLFVSGGLALYYIFNTSRITHPLRLSWIIVIVIIIDVGIHRENRFLIPAFSNSTNTFAEQSIRDYQARNDNYRLLLVPDNVTDTATFANFGMRLGAPNISAYDNMTPNRWLNYLSTMIGPNRFNRAIETSPLQLFYGDFSPRLLKHLLVDGRILGLASLRYLYSRQGSSINEHAMPRAYAVHNYIETSSEEESLKAIKANLSILNESVILENAKPTYSLNDNLSANDTNPSSVVIHSYLANQIELSVITDYPAIVVLTDAFYPGWEAYVDGEKTEIFRANSLFRAVEVPAGNHFVSFRYHPTTLYIGMTISFATLCLALILLLAEHHYRKKTNI